MSLRDIHDDAWSRAAVSWLDIQVSASLKRDPYSDRWGYVRWNGEWCGPYDDREQAEAMCRLYYSTLKTEAIV